MRILKSPPPAKLICSLFSQQEGFIRRALDALINTYGPIDLESPVMPFDWTSYYESEFGHGLKRIFVGFSSLVCQDALKDVKRVTYRLEHEFSKEGKRQVNIDPGILTAERLVLASCKNFPHRIYLGRGVFADLAFICRKGSFMPLPWTYPDYASKDVMEFWNMERCVYLEKIKAQSSKLKDT